MNDTHVMFNYWLIINHADGEPYKVRFRDASYYNYPLFVEARIPQSSRVTMAADETAVFEVAKHNVLPRLKIEAQQTIYNGAAAPRGAAAAPREIAIGARIEHPQTLVDEGRYKGERGDLPPASYRMAHNPEQGRRAHTFCMCPGGMVVPASNHPTASSSTA